MRAETILIMKYPNQHSIHLCYYFQSKYFHYVISAKIKSETNTFKQRFVHCFVNFRAKIYINHRIEDCTTKESFKMLAMFYTTILFTWKWMFKVSGTTEDCITNENFNNDSVQIFYFLRKKSTFMILFKII
jgi:hypothetical protein